MVACLSWLRVLVAFPRHSWLESADPGGGRFRGVRWGVSRGVCVCGAARVRAVSVLVCVSCVRGGGVGVGVSPVCVGVCACVCVCGGWFPRLGLAAGVGVGVAGVCCGWSLATPGGSCWVQFPATSGWLPLLVVVGAPLHSWLRAPGAVPRRSWLGSTGSGGLLSLAIPRCRSWLRFPATPDWGSSAAAVAVSVGLGVGLLVVCVLVARRMCAWCLCWCVCRVFLAVAWGWVCLPCMLVCVCVCVRVWCVAVGFPGWGLPLVWVWVRLVCVVVGPSPLLAEVPGCDSPPLLAGFRCRWWWVILYTPD